MQCQLYNQIYEDFGVPFFVDHASALTKRFDSKSSMLWGIPSFDNLAERIVPSTVLLRTFRLPLLRFFRDFSSVVSRMPGYNAKTGHGPHSPSGTAASAKCLRTLACLGLANIPLWVRTPDRLPTKAWPPNNNKSIIKNNIKGLCASVPILSSHGLQPRREIVNASTIPYYSLMCLFLSPAMRSNTRMAEQVKEHRRERGWFGWFNYAISIENVTMDSKIAFLLHCCQRIYVAGNNKRTYVFT